MAKTVVYYFAAGDNVLAVVQYKQQPFAMGGA